MSVLCSCKAWIHSSGALPDSPLAKAFTRGREGGRGGVHLSLNNSLCLSLPLSQSLSDFPPAIPLFLTLLVALSPLRVGDILGLIPGENCFHLLRSALELSGLLQAFSHSGGGVYYLSAVVWFTVFIVVSINRDPDTFRLTHFTSQSVQ